MNVEDLLELGPVELKFKKKDGSIRDMLATTCPDLIPEHGKSSGASRQMEDYIPVWDLEKEAWRAFKPSTLIEEPVAL